MINSKIPFYRDPRFRSLIIQILVLALVSYGLLFIYQTTLANLVERGIQTSVSFFDDVAPFKIGFSPFLEFNLGKTTYIEVFYIGILNTLLIAALGIAASTIVGFFIGIIRLSPNWLASKCALIYIEVFRNVPLLLQIMFWNFAVFLATLPPPKKSIELGFIYLNSRGLHTPKPFVDDLTNFNIWMFILFIGLCFCFWITKRSRKQFEQTGKRNSISLYNFFGFIIFAILSYFALGSPLGFDLPVLGKFNFKGGGQLPLPLFSLWFALTIYTSAFIAENVRAGITSVSKGQIEAARSIGLTRTQMINMIIIPQAMRVIIPPTISQFLNLTKNSSLAVAVGYEEIVAVWAGISLNQTGQALIIIAMTIIVYECMSLFTSFILNAYNRKMQIVER